MSYLLLLHQGQVIFLFIVLACHTFVGSGSDAIAKCDCIVQFIPIPSQLFFTFTFIHFLYLMVEIKSYF